MLFTGKKFTKLLCFRFNVEKTFLLQEMVVGGGEWGGGGEGDRTANLAALLQDEYQENSQRYIRNRRHIRKLPFIMILKKRYLQLSSIY